MSAAALRPILPAPLIGALGALLVLIIALVGWAREAPRSAIEPGLATQELPPLKSAVAVRFVDQTDGAVGIHRVTAAGDKRVAELAPGSDGFARGLLRGLARERKKLGAAPAAPLQLGFGPRGGLELHDPVTNSRIVLVAFGPTNEGAFRAIYDTVTAASPGSKP